METSTTAFSLRKLFAVVLMVAGLYGMVDFLMTPDRHLPWVTDEQAAMDQARADGKGLMIDFSATWCTPCAELENTFAAEGVYEAIVAGYVPVKFDVSDDTDRDNELMDKYRAHELPAVIFANAEGAELARVSEYIGADEFAGVIEKANAAMSDSSGGEPTADDRFSRALDRGWIWAFLLAFGFGFLTSLTPCVYPMIPITVAVFGARGESVSKKKAFALAACYVVGMGILYAALGTAFALAGGRSGTLLANPWVVFPVVAVLLALSASLFGAFELALPVGLQNRLNQVGGRGYAGAFGMGLVGGLVAAPCTGPFLAGMLGYVSTTGNWVAGATLLFTYALGVGVLFFVIALTSLSLPKSGDWMNWVKSIGGLALVVVALYFMRPVIAPLRGLFEPNGAYLGGSMLLVAIGLALGAVHRPFRVAREASG